MTKPTRVKAFDRDDEDTAIDDLKATLQRLNLITSTISKRIETLERQRDKPKPTNDTVMKGAKVRITRRDKYYKREGVVVGPHGTQYWDIRLDDPEELIFKKISGFEVIG